MCILELHPAVVGYHGAVLLKLIVERIRPFLVDQRSADPHVLREILGGTLVAFFCFHVPVRYDGRIIHLQMLLVSVNRPERNRFILGNIPVILDPEISIKGIRIHFVFDSHATLILRRLYIPENIIQVHPNGQMFGKHEGIGQIHLGETAVPFEGTGIVRVGRTFQRLRTLEIVTDRRVRSQPGSHIPAGHDPSG